MIFWGVYFSRTYNGHSVSEPPNFYFIGTPQQNNDRCPSHQAAKRSLVLIFRLSYLLSFHCWSCISLVSALILVLYVLINTVLPPWRTPTNIHAWATWACQNRFEHTCWVNAGVILAMGQTERDIAPHPELVMGGEGGRSFWIRILVPRQVEDSTRRYGLPKVRSMARIGTLVRTTGTKALHAKNNKMLPWPCTTMGMKETSWNLMRFPSSHSESDDDEQEEATKDESQLYRKLRAYMDAHGPKLYPFARTSSPYSKTPRQTH